LYDIYLYPKMKKYPRYQLRCTQELADALKAAGSESVRLTLTSAYLPSPDALVSHVIASVPTGAEAGWGEGVKPENFGLGGKNEQEP
jgi:hypothetical protein